MENNRQAPSALDVNTTGVLTYNYRHFRRPGLSQFYKRYSLGFVNQDLTCDDGRI
jgi:hypothetical protein